MIRTKCSELKTEIQIDNIIQFPTKDNTDLEAIKAFFNLKQCGKTKLCITATQYNIFECEGHNGCQKVVNILELFL